MDITKYMRWVFGPAGEIGRVAYFLIGAALLYVKYAVDTVIAAFWGQSWSPAYYWPGMQSQLWQKAGEEAEAMFLTVLCASLPFIWVGICFTSKRLRSAGLPLWLSLFFFVPILNLVFFTLLCVVPQRELARSAPPGLVVTRAGRMTAFAPILTTILGTALCAFDVYALGVYGFGLFVGLPFCLGMIASLILGLGGVRGAGACVGTAVGSAFCTSVALLAIGFEGAICLLMAAPLWLGCAALGGWIGFHLQVHARDQREAALLIIVLALAAPVIMGAENVIAAPAETFRVQTALTINAPPAEVWANVISFPELEPPDDWLFRVGVAYPLGATISGFGVGAERRCKFSTGDFVEPIEVWDEPNLLRFTVSSNPPPMHELSIYEHVDAPHLHGFLQSKRGQFRLVDLGDGSTRLEGTTWYEHNMQPAAYWRVWSDYILHRIHMRVLRHIEGLAETNELRASNER